MKGTHARHRPAHRRAVRAFVLSVCVTAAVLMGAWAGMLADVRTRRVCDGDRAAHPYTRLAEAVRPAFPDEPTPPEPDKPVGWEATPYPIRFLRALLEALTPAAHPDAVAVMADKNEN